MSNINTQSLNSLGNEQAQYTINKSQTKTVYEYLKHNVATASMVQDATGVEQKNITRYKRELEKCGLLAEVKHDRCEITKNRAWYLTTNPELFPKSNQLKFPFS